MKTAFLRTCTHKSGAWFTGRINPAVAAFLTGIGTIPVAVADVDLAAFEKAKMLAEVIEITGLDETSLRVGSTFVLAARDGTAACFVRLTDTAVATDALEISGDPKFCDEVVGVGAPPLPPTTRVVKATERRLEALKGWLQDIECDHEQIEVILEKARSTGVMPG